MLLLTPGEPAGVGPELLVRLAALSGQPSLCAIADPKLLQRAADRCGQAVQVHPVSIAQLAKLGAHQPGVLPVLAQPMPGLETPGQPNPEHAAYLLHCLDVAVDLCLQAPQQMALVTGPLHKASINAGGFRFSGHTEYIGQRCGVTDTVMMLADETLRVALLTTHIALREVAVAVTSRRLQQTLQIIVEHCRQRLGIGHPVIRVLGLNPHAGEGGYLGREEIDIIQPVLRAWPDPNVDLQGPLAADTAFDRRSLEQVDVILAMYHDQGLTPLKAERFGRIVNITLGLPIVRTSVDHGTALDLAILPASAAATDRARLDSLQAALLEAERQLHSLSQRR
jgi:4-hydroxythreonine-4-phosphate dehydrogenase